MMGISAGVWTRLLGILAHGTIPGGSGPARRSVGMVHRRRRSGRLVGISRPSRRIVPEALTTGDASVPVPAPTRCCGLRRVVAWTHWHEPRERAPIPTQTRVMAPLNTIKKTLQAVVMQKPGEGDGILLAIGPGRSIQLTPTVNDGGIARGLP